MYYFFLLLYKNLQLIFVYVCICEFECVYACVYACVCVCICVHVCVCVCVCEYNEILLNVSDNSSRAFRDVFKQNLVRLDLVI